MGSQRRSCRPCRASSSYCSAPLSRRARLDHTHQRLYDSSCLTRLSTRRIRHHRCLRLPMCVASRIQSARFSCCRPLCLQRLRLPEPGCVWHQEGACTASSFRSVMPHQPPLLPQPHHLTYQHLLRVATHHLIVSTPPSHYHHRLPLYLLSLAIIISPAHHPSRSPSPTLPQVASAIHHPRSISS